MSNGQLKIQVLCSIMEQMPYMLARLAFYALFFKNVDFLKNVSYTLFRG